LFRSNNGNKYSALTKGFLFNNKLTFSSVFRREEKLSYNTIFSLTKEQIINLRGISTGDAFKLLKLIEMTSDG